MKAIISYEIKQNDQQIIKIIIDMKQIVEGRYGFVWVDQAADQKFRDSFQGKVDLVFKMDENTLDRLSQKEISGWYAFVSGKIQLEGSLSLAKRMEANVIKKYKVY